MLNSQAKGGNKKQNTRTQTTNNKHIVPKILKTKHRNNNMAWSQGVQQTALGDEKVEKKNRSGKMTYKATNLRTQGTKNEKQHTQEKYNDRAERKNEQGCPRCLTKK